jgi:glutamate/tyrosine decarboxylase-like PLP-dependent enzyme
MEIPDGTGNPRTILARLEALQANDVRWRQGRAFSLAYYASAEASELAETAYRMFGGDNALNTDAFPSLKSMQADIIRFVQGLVKAPAASAGFFTSGGTESLIMAVYGAKQRALRSGRPAGNVVLPTSAHAALEKACAYFDLESRRVAVDDEWRADPVAMASAIDDATVLVVASAPQYPQGVVDPVGPIAAAALSRDIPCHVDACMGGMVLPFLEAPHAWDFSVEGVTSVSVDLHKFGYASKGAGVIIYRDKYLRAHQTFVTDNWLGGMYGSSGFLGTKSGGPIAAAWAMISYFGVEGYASLAQRARRTALSYADLIQATSPLFLRSAPDTSLLCIGSVNEDEVPVARVADALWRRGWYVDRQDPPASLHMTVNVVHQGVFHDFARDLQASVIEARSAGGSGPLGGAYGTID